jgi:hypothetical protein
MSKTCTRQSLKQCTKTAKVPVRGRPTGSGKYGVATTVMRVPACLTEEIRAFALKRLKAMQG